VSTSTAFDEPPSPYRLSNFQEQSIMKSKYIRTWILTALIGGGLLMTACNSAAPSEQQGRGKPEGNPLDASSLGLFSAIFQVYRITATYPNSKQVTDVADANFWNADSAFNIAAGAVTLNGVPVEEQVLGHGTTYHNSFNAQYDAASAVPLRFDGSSHLFDVSGNGYFAPLHDSLASPASDVNISSPHVTDSLSKGAGFTVTWTPGNAQTAFIMVVDTATTEHKVFGREIPDNGSYTVTPADLSGLAPGPIILRVEHGNFKEGTASDGRTYYMVVYAVEDLHTFMRP
jgi:hypothetical protein